MSQLSGNLEASTSWNPQGLSRPVQGLLYLLSHISGYKLMKHPTLQLSGFSCIVFADRAVTVFAVKKTEDDCSACQNTWNNSSTWHCWTPKAVLKRHQTQDQNLRISSPKLHLLQHSATKSSSTSTFILSYLQFYKTSESLRGCARNVVDTNPNTIMVTVVQFFIILKTI
jgi:hypothetical protein